MKAFLKNYRQSPRKVRLVANLIKGKSVPQAIVELDYLAKRAGEPIAKLLMSAVSNAKTNFNIEKEDLMVKELRVDKGIVMKRMMPAAMGTGHRINKRTSHITILLSEKGAMKDKSESEKNNKANKSKNTEEKKEVKEKTIKKAPAKKAVAKKAKK